MRNATALRDEGSESESKRTGERAPKEELQLQLKCGVLFILKEGDTTTADFFRRHFVLPGKKKGKVDSSKLTLQPTFLLTSTFVDIVRACDCLGTQHADVANFGYCGAEQPYRILDFNTSGWSVFATIRSVSLICCILGHILLLHS